jgi:hypothetical protein
LIVIHHPANGAMARLWHALAAEHCHSTNCPAGGRSALSVSLSISLAQTGTAKRQLRITKAAGGGLSRRASGRKGHGKKPQEG